jgi:thioredoxin reductase (NADPH)
MRIKQRNADRIAPLIADGTLKFLGATTVTSIHPDKVTLEGPDGPVSVPNDDVFILAGGIPPFGFLRELGVKFGGDQPDIVAAAV